MTLNPHLMGGSSLISDKTFIILTVTDPKYSVEGYLKAVTYTLKLQIGPEPRNTPLK